MEKLYKMNIREAFPDVEKIEARASKIDVSDNKRTVRGYALVFGARSEDMGFFETIERGAVTQSVIDASDVFAVINHSRSRGILARSRKGSGSLKLWTDDTGLGYEFTAADTAIGNELVSYLERGEIDSSSFAFTVDSENWEKIGDVWHRTILGIDRIYDVSPVFQPAYGATSVALRSVEERSAALRDAEMKERAERLEDYYRGLYEGLEVS